MPVISVGLELEEWNRVIAILATAPWMQANPLIQKIVPQIQAAAAGQPNGLRQTGDGEGATGTRQ